MYDSIMHMFEDAPVLTRLVAESVLVRLERLIDGVSLGSKDQCRQTFYVR